MKNQAISGTNKKSAVLTMIGIIVMILVTVSQDSDYQYLCLYRDGVDSYL